MKMEDDRRIKRAEDIARANFQKEEARKRRAAERAAEKERLRREALKGNLSFYTNLFKF